MTPQEIEADEAARLADAMREVAQRIAGVTAERNAITARLDGEKIRLSDLAKMLAPMEVSDRGFAKITGERGEAEMAVATLTARLAHIEDELAKARKAKPAVRGAVR